MNVYTSITGNYDFLKEQPESVCSSGAKFYAFMDRPQASRTWEVLPAKEAFHTPRLNAKFHKILSHISFPEEEITLWIDGTIEILATTSVRDLASSYLRDADMAVFHHRFRYCVYQEAMHCIHNKRDITQVILGQVFRYTQEGYPANNGLAECSVLLRRDTKQVRQFNELWWSEVQTGSIRDQISFPYVVHKTGIKLNYFPGSIGEGALFARRKHLHHAKGSLALQEFAG
jgi:hypothetical protein